MNFLKQHLSLLVPLIALLFGLQSVILIDRAIIVKEGKLLQNYSIMIASKEKLDVIDIQKMVKEVKYLENIDINNILNQLKDSLSASELSDLQNELPFFYSLKLESFPSLNRIKKIEKTLSSDKNIIKVEVFAKTHSQNYKLLLLLKGVVKVFAGIIFVLSFLLMIKHVEIWRFEHSRRMEIMNYLGAPAIMRNGILFRLSFVDSLISVFIIIGSMIYLKTSIFMQDILVTLDIDKDIFFMWSDFLTLALTAISVSILSVFIVILKPKKIWSN